MTTPFMVTFEEALDVLLEAHYKFVQLASVSHARPASGLSEAEEFYKRLRKDIITSVSELLPTDPEPPAWRDPRFDEQDVKAIFSTMRDEIADEDLDDRVQSAVESLSLAETIGYIFPDDVEAIAEMLKGIDREDYIDGEFLREHGEEEDDYPSLLNFAKRMKLINEEETALTELGHEFVAINT